MLTMKGRYNTANIMIDEIDDTTRDQIQGILNHPAFGQSYIAIMPDCHAGKGAVVGFTMQMNSYIIPNIVGVDIGCGMLSSRFAGSDYDLLAFDEYIKRNIPSGFSIHDKTRISEGRFVETLDEWTRTIDMDLLKALRSIGTLGGGNHFIEMGKDSLNRTWVTIHSGSRNFGLRVANHFQNKAKKNLERYFIRDQYKNLEFLLVDSEDGRDYLAAVRFAQRYASVNRRAMMRIIEEFFGIVPDETIESVHNFIGDDNVIRKGATPAHEGEHVIIPFNMRDGLALCAGKGSKKYNNSAPHGAGRILSRTKAKRMLSVEDFTNSMRKAGIYTTTATEETLDEAPRAYKDKEIILQNISETIDVVDFVKPIYNFKAGG